MYNTLGELVAMGEVDRGAPRTGAVAATTRTGASTPHHHLLCTTCGALFDARPGRRSARRQLGAGGDHDFRVDAVDVLFRWDVRRAASPPERTVLASSSWTPCGSTGTPSGASCAAPSRLEGAEARRLPDADGIDADTLVAAAAEVGIPEQAVRRSLALERLGPPPADGGRVLGAAVVVVEDELHGDAGDVLARLDAWFVSGHHLRRDRLRDGRGTWTAPARRRRLDVPQPAPRHR